MKHFEPSLYTLDYDRCIDYIKRKRYKSFKELYAHDKCLYDKMSRRKWIALMNKDLGWLNKNNKLNINYI